MKKHISLYLLIFALCASLSAAQKIERHASNAPAATSAAAATLSGRITGAAGVDVSGIDVYAVNTSNGDVRQTVTNANGLYSFPNLATGVTQQISPARVGYGFSPAVRFVQHNAETTNIDFVAVPFGVTSATANDFDGDGAADISVFRPSDRTWYIQPSAEQEEKSKNFAPAAFRAVQWGLSSDFPTPADFDGDGKTDIAVWRAGDASNENKSYFYILNSSNNSVRVEQFGSTGDLPFLVGDWDGDGKADPAVYRRGSTENPQSYFFYRPSGVPNVDFRTIYWGTAGDRPVRGDFDGDGRQDAAVFRPSDRVWYILQSSDNQPIYAHWGLSGDKLVPADYDGDGKTDLAVFRDGTWYVHQSSDNQPHYVRWGLGSDALVPADYDGDGKTDVAVNRGGVWYILESSSGQIRAPQFGLASDAPLPAIGFFQFN